MEESHVVFVYRGDWRRHRAGRWQGAESPAVLRDRSSNSSTRAVGFASRAAALACVVFTKDVAGGEHVRSTSTFNEAKCLIRH